MKTDSPAFARAFGVADLVAAALVVFGVFGGLPARWAPVDVGAVLVALLLGTGGLGLVTRSPWGPRVARVASIAVLAIGLLLILMVGLAASYLAGIFGPVGRGGMIIMVLVAALALPYLVVLPALQLLWLGPPRKGAP